jgi:hypothetical protein
MRGSRPGERRGGRQRGTPNKVTADLKAAILSAFEEVGSASYLAKIAKENPAIFCALLGKVLPRDIKAEHSGGLTLSELVQKSMLMREIERELALPAGAVGGTEKINNNDGNQPPKDRAEGI